MRENSLKGVLLIGLTLLTAMMLLIFPLPRWVVWWRPLWVFLVLLFWMITLPHRVGIAAAWFVGLWVDLLTGSLLGQHALILSVIAYVVIKFQTPIRNLPFWQQTIFVFVITVVYLALQYWIMALAGMPPDTAKYWLPVLTTTLLWPWMSALLRDLQHRFSLPS